MRLNRAPVNRRATVALKKAPILNAGDGGVLAEGGDVLILGPGTVGCSVLGTAEVGGSTLGAAEVEAGAVEVEVGFRTLSRN